MKLEYVQSVDQLLEELGRATIIVDSLEPTKTRVARRREWAQSDRVMSQEDRDLIESLTSVLGQAPVIETGEELDQEQVDLVAEEVKVLREMQDVVEARTSALRRSVFTSLDTSSGETEPTPGTLYSPRHQYKLAREIRGGKTLVEWERLEEVVDPETWESVTNRVVETRKVYRPGSKRANVTHNEYREINEDEVLKAIRQGRITLEQLSRITTQTKKTSVFAPKAMKPGEEMSG